MLRWCLVLSDAPASPERPRNSRRGISGRYAGTVAWLAFAVILLSSFYWNVFGLQPKRYTFGGRLPDFGALGRTFRIVSEAPDQAVLDAVAEYALTGHKAPSGHLGTNDTRIQSGMPGFPDRYQPSTPGIQAYILSFFPHGTAKPGPVFYAHATLVFAILTTALVACWLWRVCALFGPLSAGLLLAAAVLSDWVVFLARRLLGILHHAGSLRGDVDALPEGCRGADEASRSPCSCSARWSFSSAS